jgi:hypothetical protein
MAQVKANTVITIPAYITNTLLNPNITVTDPISGTKLVVFETGYYEFVFNDGNGDGTALNPFHILLKLAQSTTENWTYKMEADGRITIGYLGNGTATFTFNDLIVKEIFGSTVNQLTFNGPGSQTLTYPAFGLFISRSRKGDGQWKHSPGFSVYQATTSSKIFGWNDGNHKQTRKFSFDFLPRDQSFKDSGMVSTPAYPIDANTWNTTPTYTNYTAPYTALRFLKETQGKQLKLYLGPLPYDGIKQYYKVYFTVDSIKKQNRFSPSINGNEKYVTMDEVEVLLYGAANGEANYATGYLPIMFSPSSIPNLYMWLRSDDVIQNSGTVSQVNDKSGNGRHAVQPTNTSRPFYFPNGGLNDLPYWQGTSANVNGRYLLAGNTNDFDFLHNGGDWTIIYVSSTPVNNGKTILGTQHGSQFDAGFSIYEAASPGVTYYMGNGVSTVLTMFQTSGFTPNQWQKTIIRYKDSVAPHLKATSETDSFVFNTSKFNSNSLTPSGMKFGVGCAGDGTLSSDAKFQEIIVYNRALSDPEVSQIQLYLLNRYGFNPANIPGLQAWWTAEDVNISGGKITQFNDKSGYARDATNSNPTYQVIQSVDPAYNNKKIAVTNGNASQTYTPPSFIIPQPFTVFAVGNGNINDWETFLDSSSPNRVIFRKDYLNNMTVYAGVTNVTIRNFNAKTNPVIAWCEYNGAFSKANVNSLIENSISSPGTNTLQNQILLTGIGGAYPFSSGAKFATLFIYNRILTTDEKTKIINYLSNLYNITLL